MSANESRRLQALADYGVMDTEAEQAYDDIARIATGLFGTPIGLVSFVGEDRQWFKARIGMNVRQTERSIAFCDHAIRSQEVLVVEDAREDPRFAANPLVTGPLGVRFYAGAPLITPDGCILGTVCVLDHRPRCFDESQRESLAALSRQVVSQLELRRQNAALTQVMHNLNEQGQALREAQDRLQLSDLQMQEILNGTTEAWWDMDLRTGGRYYSPSGWALLGYQTDELPYDEALWGRLIHPDDLERSNRQINQAIAEGRNNFSMEMRLCHKNGHPVPVYVRGQIARDADGKAVRITGTDTDLRERENAQLALRNEQQLNQQIFRNAPVGIVIYDRQGNCLAANRTMATIIGSRPEQMQVQNFHHIESWKKSGLHAMACRALESGAPESGVVEVTSSFGKSLWMTANFSILNFNGESRLMLMCNDISSFRKMEREREELRETYEMLFLNSMDGVIHSRVDGQILAANPAALALLGMDLETIRSRGREGVLWTQDPRLEPLLVEREHKGKAHGEVFMLRGDGERFEAEISSATYRGPDGALVASTVFRDITERKAWANRLEQSLNLLKNLAQRVPGVIYQFRMFPDGRSCFPFASDGIWDIYEVRPEEVQSDATVVFARLHPEDYELIANSIVQSASSLLPWELEYRVMLPHQGLRWRHGIAQPERLDDGSTLWHGCITDITERKQAEEETYRLAYYDALTGLPNRRMLSDRLRQSLDAARRTDQMGAVIFLDLDNFKRINDARGHSVGDQLLRQVARRLTELLRTVDMVGRLGGDEFVVLVNDLGNEVEAAAHAAMVVAERIRSVLEAPYLIDDYLYSGTGSIGLTLFPKPMDVVDDLLREADTAMYRAKSMGRNRIAYYEAAMQTEVENRLALEQDLKDALGTEQISLHIQSQVDRTGSVIGGELLLRWKHPQRGFVSPVDFIPVAEESGLILRLGDFVVETACRAIVRLQVAGTPLPLSINISPRQFRQEDFVEQVRRVLRETGADPQLLVFEVTEGLLIESWETVASRMMELTQMGIRFSIDDFGTGYSSLSYLKKLPLHELKIDKSFVQNTPDDANDRAIVRSILAVAKAFRLHVVAEGVETQAQADFLAGLQCDALQGYLFARPEPLDGWLLRRLQGAVAATS